MWRRSIETELPRSQNAIELSYGYSILLSPSDFTVQELLLSILTFETSANFSFCNKNLKTKLLVDGISYLDHFEYLYCSVRLNYLKSQL